MSELTAEGAALGDAPQLSADGRLLVVRFARPHRTLSWAVARGGLQETRAVVWRYVTRGELGLAVDAAALLHRSLREGGLTDAVGMLTARTLSAFDCVTKAADGQAARAVATVGLSNAVAVGDAPGPLAVGTINILVQLSHPAEVGTLAEALSLAAEARTAAVMAAGLPSRRSGALATGTGTDCIVVAAPLEGAALQWVGKHTVMGALLGGAVYAAVGAGVERWMGEQGLPLPAAPPLSPSAAPRPIGAAAASGAVDGTRAPEGAS